MTTTRYGGVPAAITVRERSGWQSLGNITAHRTEDDALIIECGEARVRLSVEREDMIRVRLAPRGKFRRDFSWAVQPDAVTRVPFGLEEHDEHLEMVTDQIRVRIARRPCRISFHTNEGDFIAADDASKGMAWDGPEIRCWKALGAGDHFFGFGEKGPPLDKRNGAIVNWNHDAAEHEPFTDPLYQTHPFVIALSRGRAHGLFFDNTYRSFFDLGKTSRTAWSFGADGGELDYYFIPGPTPGEVVRRYGRLVGTTPLPPMWALGYQQCRWSYESAKRAQRIAKEFRRRKIPCDTIYLDIDYMDGFRCFTWDPKRFAKPSALLTSLARQGFKTVVIIDPGIKAERGYAVFESGAAGDHFCRDADGHVYVGKVWPGESVYPDYTRESTRHWWGDLYKKLIADGVTGFWNDMNEPADFTHGDGTIPLTVRFDNEGEPTDHREAHNVYGMQMARATFEGMLRLRRGERPFVLTRAGYAGVQRYAAVWTGDNASTWDHLRMSLPMLLSMSVSGVSFCGADVGGFRAYPTPELYTRWLQLGIFYPLCRTHTAGGAEQDPWSFGKRHERINRSVIELRYAMLPYLYSEMQYTTKSGAPLLRPVFLDFPEMKDVHKLEHEFLFGRQLYVAPVVHEGAKERKFRLPPGEWYGFDDGARRTGDAEHKIAVGLETIPMFARAGAVIPMRRPVQFVDDKPLNELILSVYPGRGRGCFYNDDGRTYDYQKGRFVLDEYETTSEQDATVLKLARRTGRDAFAPKAYLVKFNGVLKPPAAVELTGRKLAECKDARRFEQLGGANRSDGAWRYDKKSRVLWVRLKRFTPSDALAVIRKA